MRGFPRGTGAYRVLLCGGARVGSIASRRWLATSNLQAPGKGGLSYVKGDTDSQSLIVDETLYGRLRMQARNVPDADALVVCDGNNVSARKRLTYADLLKEVDRFADGMASRLSVGRGDKVAIWMPNCVEWVVAKYATWKIGGIVVNVNPSYRSRELNHALNLVGAKVLFMVPRLSTSKFDEILLGTTVPCLEHVVVTDHRYWDEDGGLEGHDLRAIEKLKHGSQWKIHRFNDVYDDGAPKAKEPEDLSPYGAANIQFTSGTTGLPKAALLNHVSLINNSRGAAQNQRLGKGDRVCIPVPLYHCFGLTLGNLCCVEMGATMIYPASTFNALKTLQVVHAEDCTALYGVPTMFIAMISHPEFSKFSFPHLRTGIMAGSNCPVELMRRLINEMNMRDICIGYGQTEVAPLSFMSNPDVPVKERCETVGKIMPHVEVKVVDASGQPVPVGTIGEVWTRGYSVFMGYYNDEEKTKEALTEDGWMKSGDLATMDEEGYLRIVGRIKDMVIRGGENLYPREIEELIIQLEGIIDVQVVGVKDEFYGEELCAVVIFDFHKLKMDQEQAKDYIRNYVRSNLSHQKVPKYVVFRQDYSDVLTVTGKIQKHKLRDIIQKQLQL